MRLRDSAMESGEYPQAGTHEAGVSLCAGFINENHALMTKMMMEMKEMAERTGELEDRPLRLREELEYATAWGGSPKRIMRKQKSPD